MIRRFTEYAVLALALSLPLAACDGDSNVGLEGDGRVTLLLTDAPGDFHAAVVTISKVYLQGSDGPFVLSEEETTTDLLTLVDEVQELAKDVVVPGGVYSQLRFVIDGGYIEVEQEDGSTRIYATQGYEHVPEDAVVGGTLQCPSCGESGLKVNFEGGAIDLRGQDRTVLVDFDVSQSFGHQAGNSGQWVMHPVIKAADFSLSGDVEVFVSLAEGATLPSTEEGEVTLADFAVTLTADDDGVQERALVETDDEGVYRAAFRYLIPGTYTVALVAPEGVDVETDPELPVEVSVGSGESPVVEIVVE